MALMVLFYFFPRDVMVDKPNAATDTDGLTLSSAGKATAFLRKHRSSFSNRVVVIGDPSMKPAQQVAPHAAYNAPSQVALVEKSPKELTEEELEEEALRETIGEWKPRENSYAEEPGRFKVFHKYKGRRARNLPQNIHLGAHPESNMVTNQLKDMSVGEFTCTGFSGIKRYFPRDQFNDGYCDCLHGEDEPGTSACAHVAGAKFYCGWKLEKENGDKLIKPDSVCISWRQTGGCSPSGNREPHGDRGCQYSVPPGASGFCECEKGRKVAEVGCGHEHFTCFDMCLSGHARRYAEHTDPKSFVFSSRVNDGVCDCCNGADEWKYGDDDANGKNEDGGASSNKRVRCTNTCAF